MGNDWKSWSVGKAFPLCLWTFLLVFILFSLKADALQMFREGVRLESFLLVARGGLRGAFMVLLVAAYLTRFRTVERAQGFWERTFPLLVLLATIVGLGLLESHEGSLRVHLAGAGLFLAPLGLCLSVWSLWHLRSSFSILAEARCTVVSGPYQYVRHPLYLGEILTMLGVCLMIGTGIALLFWGVISGSQLARARIEEKKLSQALPDYETYRRKTPFIFPDFLGGSR